MCLQYVCMFLQCCVQCVCVNTSSPDGVLDPDLQSTSLSALQSGQQAGQAPRPAVRLLLGVLLGHHGGPRYRTELDWTGGVDGRAGLSNMDRRTLRC